jgi:hypothetical protein
MGQVFHGGATTTAAIRLTRAAGALQAAVLPSLTPQLAICNTGKCRFLTKHACNLENVGSVFLSLRQYPALTY